MEGAGAGRVSPRVLEMAFPAAGEARDGLAMLGAVWVLKRRKEPCSE